MAKYETCANLVHTNSIEVNPYIPMVIEKLTLLPEKMIKEFADNDWHIFVTNGSIENHIGEREHDNGLILGITFFECRTIFMPILKYQDIDIDTVVSAVIHEFGHYFDRTRGIISMSYKFQQIYNEDDITFCDNVGTAGNTVNATEFFAEAFSAFVLRNDMLREYCPTTYEYFKNIFFEYSDFR